MQQANLILLWPPLLVVFYFLRAKLKLSGIGLVTVYLVNFAALHGITSAIRLLPWFRDHNPRTTAIGLALSTYALGAFVVGSLFLSPFILNYWRKGRRSLTSGSHPELPYVYLAIGILGFIASGVAGQSLAIVTTTGTILSVVGLCLLCWRGIQTKRADRLIIGIGLTLLIPLVTIVSRGFAGFGMATALVVGAFLASFYPRRRTIVISILVTYIGLSFYVTYMRDRGEIRKAVWGGESFSNRVLATESLSDFEWLDLSNPRHLNRFDARLNQNMLIGLAVDRLARNNDFAHGETLWMAVLAVIPRVIWPEKPVGAGSGDLVSRYTGLTFAGGTSVGIGQVLEFYVNYGTAGVVLGFFFMGALVTFLDVTAREALVAGDQQGFALRLVVGLGLMQVGGSFVEASSTAVGGLLIVWLLNHYLLSDYRKKRGQKRVTAPAPPAEGRFNQPPLAVPTPPLGARDFRARY